MKAQQAQGDDKPKAPPVARACFTVAEFCEAHRISRSHFYDLARRGDGPAIIKAGNATLISVEAAGDWRRRMEADCRTLAEAAA